MATHDVLAELQARGAPSLRLVAASTGRSQLCGRPRLGERLAWPQKNGRPLSFLAQIDLEEVRTAGGPDWLPTLGRLFFFYDIDGGGWGFSPADGGDWAVLFDDAAGPDPAESRPPDPTPPEFALQTIGFRPHPSLPSEQRLQADTAPLDDSEADAVFEAVQAGDGNERLHQIGGWPRPIQNDDMELECQLASNGIDCGDPDAHRSDAAKRLAAGADEWRLLLQLDSDDDSGMMWGDSGLLYFWIREREARAGDFSKPWMILQCC